MISFAFNFKLLRSFLTANSDVYEQLSGDRFTTRYMVPYQILRSFIRAANRFIVVLDPEISMNSHDTIHQWMALFNAVYPFTPLINITSALCWSHVMEKFHAKGAYNFFQNDDDNTNFKSKRRESL
uniref:Uncharacterized protein n=1 Tax=Panagrolaimus sp. ES5 TaxID=591445 RepID=A0AC34FZN9_9BILA